MPAPCCVPMCHERIGGHKFPADPHIYKKWQIAIKRTDSETCKLWTPGKHDVVCRLHFLNEDYRQLEISSGLQRRLTPDAVPSLFPFQKVDERNLIKRKEREERNQKRKLSKPLPDLEINRETQKGRKNEFENSAQLVSLSDFEIGSDICVGEEQSCSDVCEEKEMLCAKHTSTQCNLIHESPVFSIERFKNDSKAISYYTGFNNFGHFKIFFQILGPAACNLKYHCRNLHPEDELFLVLVKLRQATDDYHLSTLFGISERTVARIFYTWIAFLYFQLQELNFWPCKEVVQATCPKSFYEQFPSTRVILDATEIPIEKPTNITAQKATFSTYKNKNTVKVIIGCTPRGLVSYVSNAYGGSTSDRQIIERSKLLNENRLERGDSIMADRGILVQDLFASQDVQVNTPAMLKGKSQLEPQQVIRDRRIASKRIHVERVIGLTKTYKFIKKELHSTKVHIADRILYVCFMLSNFRNSIVSRFA